MKRNVRAIVVVHVFGSIAETDILTQIAKKHNLAIIEDATEALGSCYEEQDKVIKQILMIS